MTEPVGDIVLTKITLEDEYAGLVSISEDVTVTGCAILKKSVASARNIANSTYTVHLVRFAGVHHSEPGESQIQRTV